MIDNLKKLIRLKGDCANGEEEIMCSDCPIDDICQSSDSDEDSLEKAKNVYHKIRQEKLERILNGK